MYHLSTNRFFSVIIIIKIIIFSSCAFVDLRPIKISTSPEKQNSILSDEHSPISVTFNTAMNKKEAENLLIVSCDAGIVNGDRFWKGDTLFFIPAAGWTAGTRYLLGLCGFAGSVDGREIRLERYVSFYALNRSASPLIEWYSPADCESVYTGNLRLIIRFSQPMDRFTVESAFNAEGMGDKKFDWPDDRTLTIIPERNLVPWAVCRWSVKNTAKSIYGVPLVKTYSGSFSTDLDMLLPEVYGVYPAIQADGRWFPSGGNLEEDFGCGLGLIIEFNKAMNDSILKSIRFEPSLTGRTEMLSSKSMIFIPARDPEPEIVYTLIISGDAKDEEGLKIGCDYRRTFIADIPWMRIISINVVNGNNTEPVSGGILSVPVSEADGDIVRFTIHFSVLFDKEAKQKTALAISLVPFFPVNLEPVALRYVLWPSDDRLTMGWERLKPGSDDEPHYYKLQIPGGRNGICGSGIYLKQDMLLYAEAVK